LLPDAKPTLLPVILTALMASDQLPALSSSASTACLTIEFGQVPEKAGSNHLSKKNGHSEE
jgi:hypothetical protein